ncbi:hypothetical protein MPSEU_000821100 [Mayamaea pseudoterrestris]|nr:hypothetical protein MPSEU_000821100 [Mayamaea pseudoterrestris]
MTMVTRVPSTTSRRRTARGAGSATSDNDSSTQNIGGSGGSTVNGGGPKTGRKGDARMHRAVAARLADGAISLFEALQIGGFGYSVDDDANALDQEGVTLGQRKNQLSRRLRQARKHPHPGMEDFIQTENERKRQNVLLDEEVEECRKTPKQAKTEHEQAFLPKNHPAYGHSMIPQARTGQQQGSDANAVHYTNQNGKNGYHKIPSQVHVQHQQEPMYATSPHPDPPSGVALATFHSIAQSLGMSMEQLALALSSSDNLLQALSTDEKEKRRKQMELACNLYTNELQALIQRCMLLAGYTIERAQEGTPCNLEFSVLAWKQEGERLKAIYNQKYINEPPIQATIDQVLSATKEHAASKCRSKHSQSNDTKAPQPAMVQVQIDTRAVQDQHNCSFPDGRHLHLLEGKCGHKAILHQPANGNAHIDFVVGNKIECYAHVQPIANGHAQNISVWPSQYNCQGEEVASSAKSACSQSVVGDQHHDDASTVNTPRILDLDDVDFTGQEWNAEFTNDESLLGLFKLSDGRSLGPSDCHSLMGASTTGSLHGSRQHDE